MKLFASILLLTALLHGQAPESTPAFKQARTLYFQGADGDSKAYDRADQLFSQLREKHPNSPRIQVYYGSLRLVAASHTWLLWKKNALSREGIELMDAAVTAVPSDLEVRFVRAATTYDLPGFFHRKEQSAQDFAYLAERAPAAARSGALEPRLAAASLYYHGVFLQESGKPDAARSAWNQAVALAPQSRAARESREKLDAGRT